MIKLYLEIAQSSTSASQKASNYLFIYLFVIHLTMLSEGQTIKRRMRLLKTNCKRWGKEAVAA
jgi:hypothetical protein